MTILVDHEIEAAIESGWLIIEPYDKNLVQPNSYDVRLDSYFSWYETSSAVIDPFDSKSILESLTKLEDQSFIIQPNQFVLGATLEKFSLPANIVGQLTGKSSLARLGVMVHVTAGFIDAGFSHPPAKITLEIVNVGSRPVRLYAGMSIAQMVFTQTAPCTTPYNIKSNAKYNGQPAAAPSLYHLNTTNRQE